eukprot:scaffold17303_cov39-Phaeocystis_antarctica.AAC.1
MLARYQPVDSDDFGETIARFPAVGASSSQSGGAQSSFSLHRRALMAWAQRPAGEHCGRRMTRAQTEPRWARCPASDFVELLGATRAQTSGLARCHGAAGETDPPTRQVRTKGHRRDVSNPTRQRALNCRSGGGSGMQRTSKLGVFFNAFGTLRVSRPPIMNS